jgi:DNA repair protein RadD
VFQLRDYQTNAVLAAHEIISSGKNGLLVMPTGSGKSLVIAGVAQHIPGKVLVLQPNKEILEQNYQKLHQFGESTNNIGIYSASAGYKFKAKVTFATIGSIINKLDMFKDVDVVMVDECHLVNAKTGQYKELIEALGKPVVGLTATPYRMSASFGGEVVEAKFLHRTRPRIFDHVKYVAQAADLHDQGYLAPIEYHVDHDYDPYKIKLNSTGLNYDERSLKAYNQASHLCKKAADTVVNHYDSVNHFLIFVSSIDESLEVENLLKLSGIPVSHVDGTTNKSTREMILGEFKAGHTKVVTNVGVLTTGFDFPALDGIVLARPMMSLPLYYQMVGRGVRKHESKQRCNVFDLCGNVNRFGEPDKYRIEAEDNYKYRLRSGNRYLTGVNFVTGRDLEKQRNKAQKKKEQEMERIKSGDEVIPFGKYKGQYLSQIPKSYLDWAVKEFNNVKWKTLFQEELAKRAGMDDKSITTSVKIGINQKVGGNSPMRCSCPKCGRPMTRKTHPPGWRPKPTKAYYFEYWDTCKKCQHVQHYEAAKRYVAKKEVSPA